MLYGVAMCGGHPRAEGTLLAVSQKITFVNLYPVFLYKRPVLLSKGRLLMVLLLPNDIVYDFILISKIVTEAAIFVSPTTKIWKMWIDLQPFAAISLYSLYKRS